MAARMKGNVFHLSRYNNYLIGGNACNAFGLGRIGAQRDFWLLGAEPEDESSFPLLSGRILNSEGELE